MAEFVVVGNCVVDLIARPVESLPPPGQLLYVEAIESHVGGNGPNTAAALAKLGARAAAIGRVGCDAPGDWLLARLERLGVDTRGIVRDRQHATAITLVCVDRSGERRFLHHLGANATLTPADVDDEPLRRARHLHLGSHFALPALDGEPAASLLRRARAAGLTTSLDVCWDAHGRWLELLRPCLPWADLFLPNEEEARALTGESEPRAMARRLHALGVATVVIKRGAKGCYASDGRQEWEIPAFAVPVRDTTGAGDCFVAGFLYARGAGWEMERALRFACACGALSVQALGAVTALGSAAEVVAWMEGAGVRSP